MRPGDHRVLLLSDTTYAELVAIGRVRRDTSPGRHVDLTDGAAIPLIAVTGDQLVPTCDKRAKRTGCADN